MKGAVLEVEGLSKRYGAHQALEGLAFSVGRGEVFALLGPNGAGKTTALEIIEGIREADAGRVAICGKDASRSRTEALGHLGVQLQAQGLPPTMRPAEALAFFAAYRGRSPRAGILARFGLDAAADRACRDLSTGLQRRLALALALAHSPDILILDEPTAGLDVESRNVLHAAIREERGQGTTVILASHDMAEVEKLADRALILVAGRTIALGSPRELTACGDAATRVSVLTRDGSLGSRAEEAARFARAGGPPPLVDREGCLRFRVDRPGPALAWVIGEVEAAGDEILDLRVERPSLEERFLELAGGAA